MGKWPCKSVSILVRVKIFLNLGNFTRLSCSSTHTLMREKMEKGRHISFLEMMGNAKCKQTLNPSGFFKKRSCQFFKSNITHGFLLKNDVRFLITPQRATWELTFSTHEMSSSAVVKTLVETMTKATAILQSLFLLSHLSSNFEFRY